MLPSHHSGRINFLASHLKNSCFHYKDATLEQDRDLHMQMDHYHQNQPHLPDNGKKTPAQLFHNRCKRPLKMSIQDVFSPSPRVPQSSCSKQNKTISILCSSFPKPVSLFHHRKMNTEKSRKKAQTSHPCLWSQEQRVNIIKLNRKHCKE